MTKAAGTHLSPIEAFRQALLPATIQNALRTQFYRELWAGLDTSEPELRLLGTLPTVQKEMIRRAGRRAQVRDGRICDELFTSGTTGRPLITVRSHDEQSYIYDFFNAQLNEGPSPGRIRRGLQIRNPYHGHQVRIPTMTHFHGIGIYDSGSFEHGRSILLKGGGRDSGVDDECTLIVSLERSLRAFTQYLAEARSDAADMDVEVVVSYSQYLTRTWRSRFEATFGAPVVDRYSLAEIFGGASSCLSCDWWHFDPFLVPQVVGARSCKPVREGLGLLLLTALFPFQQSQPMVRYHTGDLVKVTQTLSCRPDELAVRPLGRAAFGVQAGDGDDWLVYPVDALEVLDPREDVARMPRFVDSPQVRDPYAIGHPRYRMTSSIRNGVTEVNLVVQSARRLRGLKREEFAQSIAINLLQEAPGLSRAVEDGSARLRVSVSQSVQTDLVSHSE